MQLTKLISLLPFALSVVAMAGIGTYGRSGTLTARNAEAGTLLGGVDDGAREVFARDAEAEPLEDEAELEMRELHEYMRKRVRRFSNEHGARVSSAWGPTRPEFAQTRDARAVMPSPEDAFKL
ncbi:hypothetical protein MMC34_008069 [Xylographa carneopallida]|nr:hypothetical protein [Xylographa carneopallida]